MSEVRVETASARVVIIAPCRSAFRAGGRFLALAEALGQIEDQILHEAYDESAAAALRNALAACPIDSPAGLRWATREIRQLLEIEEVSDWAVMLGRKIEAYAAGINLPDFSELG